MYEYDKGTKTKLLRMLDSKPFSCLKKLKRDLWPHHHLLHVYKKGKGPWLGRMEPPIAILTSKIA